MRLQLIASESHQTIDPLQSIKQKFLDIVNVNSIESAEEIDSLNKILLQLNNGSFVQQYDVVNPVAIKNQARLAKQYYDPNSKIDNFI